MVAINFIIVACSVLFLVERIESIAIDNGVEGIPTIDCGRGTISVNFVTKNNFGGRIFVKGQSKTESCSKPFTLDQNSKAPEFRLEGNTFAACGIREDRRGDGILISVLIIISFHDTFITKVDKAYRIECTYRTSDANTLSYDLAGVSMITDQSVTKQIEMPNCRYQVLDEQTNQVIRFATIGQKVLHKWTCFGSPTDYCMLVHSCYALDATDEKQLLDTRGCTVDEFLLQTPELQADSPNLMYVTRAHVFKFADVSTINFRCQVDLKTKEANIPCDQCPARQVASAVVKRAIKHEVTNIEPNTQDVVAREIQVIDDLPQDIDGLQEAFDLQKRLNSQLAFSPVTRENKRDKRVCLDYGRFHTLLVIALLMLTVIMCTVVFTVLLYRRNKQQQLFGVKA